MGQGEQHAVAALLQIDGHVAVAAEFKAQLPWRIEFGDPAPHPVLLIETLRALAGILQLLVTPDELERRSGFQLHLAGGKPLAAKVAVGQIGPDAVDDPSRTPRNISATRRHRPAPPD